MHHPYLHRIVLNSSKMKLGTWASATFREKKREIHITTPQYIQLVQDIVLKLF